MAESSSAKSLIAGIQLQDRSEDPWRLMCSESSIQSTQAQFIEVMDVLLEQVQLNSTHLFRADILHDSAGKLQTLAEKEIQHDFSGTNRACEMSSRARGNDEDAVKFLPPSFEGFIRQRTVIRRLVPRKPQLDNPLNQSCFTYFNSGTNGSNKEMQAILVVYVPHYTTPEDMPWYHPKVRGLAYLCNPTSETTLDLSMYFLLFSDASSVISERLQRTSSSLLNTLVRLLKLPSKSSELVLENSTSQDITNMSLSASSLKDTILPQHIVQNTYSRLKGLYAADLISRWIEKTEPSKHVFEDLSIAAFLIELWKSMYESGTAFPGFADIACGNGVLTYILIKEGWQGRGFDARRRKTWDILDFDTITGDASEYLKEQVCIPQPFIDLCDTSELDGLEIHNGIFPGGTFIISNHADELTCWTPTLAALSSPSHPLPFLAIPCCSHALDGSKHRYTVKEIAASIPQPSLSFIASATGDDVTEEEQQPAEGDLRALRAAKQNQDTSTYASLTRKAAALAQELDMLVQLTLMRIPSTRNIGIVGNRDLHSKHSDQERDQVKNVGEVEQKIHTLLKRECALTGGMEASAKTWMEKVKKLKGGQGRGKVNWKTSAVKEYRDNS